MVANLPGDAGLRILEAGAGTGATTEHLLPRLPRGRSEYVFTDVSRGFLETAVSRFSGYRGLRTALLDLESDPRAQGFAPSSFDVVVAANVLHATSDLSQSLQAIRDLLAPGGALILLEGTASRRWVDLVFGTTDGWWRFQDTELRSHPLVSAEQWHALLQAAGFVDTEAVSFSGDDHGGGLDQVLMVSRVPEGSTSAVFSRGEDSGGWLVCADSPLIGEALAQRLRARGESAHTIEGMPTREDLARWIDTRGSAGSVVVVADRADVGEREPGEILAAVAERHDRMVAVIDELAGRRRADRDASRLWIVTRGAEPVGCGEQPDVVGAALWGLGRMVAREEPSIWGGLVDLSAAEPPEAQLDSLVSQLISQDAEDQVALRAGDRFVARLLPSSLEGPVSPDLSRSATYVIVGGLGRLGRIVLPWLAAQGAGKLVVVGRSTLPPEADWPTVDAASDLGARIAAIQQARQQGATVQVEAVDVADTAALGSLIDRIQRDDCPVRGIFHMAMGPESGPVVETFGPKVAGAWALHTVVEERGLELDHLLFFSSVSSVLGSRGVRTYASANHFLDALAHLRHAGGRPGLAINWGGWAGGPETEAALLDINHIPVMEPDRALAALGQLMGDDAPQKVVARVDWEAMHRDYSLDRPRRFLDEVHTGEADDQAHPGVGGASENTFASTLSSLSSSEAHDQLLACVRQTVAQVVGIDAERLVEPGQGFFKLGMDSLMTVELRGRLQGLLGLRLPATIALEYPTVEALAEHLAGELGLAGTEGDGTSSPPDWLDRGLDDLDEGQLATRLDDALATLFDDEEPDE